MDHIHRIWATTPAVIMAAGTVPMISSNAPEHVRYGGICLAAIAAIIADLKNGKKLGYTDKIVSAVRTIPGMKDADEGTVLGTLCIGASAFLGGGAALNIAETGNAWPEGLKLAYNALNYPLAATCDFRTTRQIIERFLGKEFTFRFKDADGKIQTTTPIPTVPLLQQAALFNGAMGITTYGTALGVGAIQYTGIMFMLSNGLSIAQLTGSATKEKLGAKLKAMAARAATPLTPEEQAKLMEQIRGASGEFLDFYPPPPIQLLADTPAVIARAIEPTIDDMARDRNIGISPPDQSPQR
ncbi:MAG: hypothetical protein ACK502_00575 [Alphaproteobacteria bacterium]